MITLAGSSTNTLLVALQAVLLIPFYTRQIGPTLYGAWLGSGDVLVWLQAFDLGLPNLMIQRVASAHGRGDHKAVAEWFASSMFALGVIGCVVAIGGLLISRRIATILSVHGKEAEQLQTCFAIAALVTGVLIVNNGLVGFSRAVQRTGLTNVVTTLAGLAGSFTSLWLILHGFGLFAIPFGMVVRAVATLLGTAWFSLSFLTLGFLPYLRVRKHILREVLLISPVTALGTLGYAMMNQSETVLAAALFRPELAIVLNLTKKAADVCRTVIDMIGFASYGGFANLVTSSQRHKAQLIHSDIVSLRLSLAILAAVAYMCVNPTLVPKWVGQSYFGGPLLTVIMGLHLVVVGGSFLTNYLYRATGQIVSGSLLLIAESILRIPLMIFLGRLLRMPGLLLGGIITAWLATILVQHWTKKQLSPFSEPASPPPPSVWAARVGVFAVGATLCLLLPVGSVVLAAGAGALAVLFGAAALVCVDPSLR